MSTAVAPKPAGAGRAEARVRHDLDRAAGRIRAADATGGAAALVVLALGYAVAGILLDRWLDLPREVRQLGFAGFVVTALGLGYSLVVRPLRRAVNPRYAARRIEGTVPDAKNAVINWVDLAGDELPDVVRAAVAAQAAGGLAGADVGKATDSRRATGLVAAAVLLLVVLAGLLVVCKPAQFFSLLGRTFNPFTFTRIAARTEITLVEPAGGDVTVTAGQPLTVSVGITGSVPDPEGSSPVRLEYRHNAAATEYDSLPLERGANDRELSVRVPDHVVQNGFWYRVAGGDGLTPEYRVTVRSRPLFKGYEVRYEYPAYLRMKPETAADPAIEAYRGTEVTVTARTNRTLRSGKLLFAGKPDPLVGEVLGENKDTLRFKLSVAEDAVYRLVFTAADGEAGEPTVGYPVRVLADRPPTVDITDPKADEIALPSNGLLKVDGSIGDDFGIDKVTLRLRVAGDTPVPLAPLPYQGGRSFRRESDGTFPTALEYKDSVKLSELKLESGKPAGLKPGVAVEFWLEAADNCDVPPGPNVGRSAVRRVRLGEPLPELPKNQPQAGDAQRKTDERNHREQQDAKLKNESREPPPPLKPQDKQDPANGEEPGAKKDPADGRGGSTEKSPDGSGEKSPDGAKGSGEGGTSKSGGDPKDGKSGKPDEPRTDAKPPDGGKPSGEPGTPDKKTPDSSGNEKPSKAGDNTGASGRPDADLQKKADEAREELKRQETQAGDGKGGGESQPKSQPADPAEKKPAGPKDQADAETPKPDAGGSGDPRKSPDAKPGPSPAEPKGSGKTEAPPEPSQSKEPPADKAGNDQAPTPNDKGDKGDAVGGSAGGEKPKPGPRDGQKPKEPPADPKSGGQEPKSADAGQKEGEARGATGDKKDGSGKPDKPDESAQPGTDPGKQAGGAKPKKTPERAEERSAPRGGDAADGNPPDGKSGAGKAEQPPPSGQAKPKPDAAGGGSGDKPASEPKPETDPAGQQAGSKPDAGSGKPAGQKPGGGDPDPAGPKPPGADERAQEKPAGGGQPQPGESTAGDSEPPPGKLDRELSQDGKPISRKEDVDRLIRENQERKSADPKTRDRAQNNMDKRLSRDDQKKLDQAAQGEKSSDPKTKEQAKQDLDELTKKSRKAEGQDDPGPQEKTANKSGGEDAGKNAGETNGTEQPSGDNTAGSGGKTAPRQPKKPGDKGGPGTGKAPSKEEVDAARKQVNDLASDDKATREKAEKEMDRKVGEAKRKEMQQAARDAKDAPPDQQKAAGEKRDQMAEEAAGAGPPQGDAEQQKQARQQAEKMSKQADDLASTDKGKREAAEKALDERIGQEKRKQLQQAMKDMKSGDPQKAADAKKQLEQMVKDAQKGKPDGEPGTESAQEPGQGKPGDDWKPGGAGSRGRDAEPLSDDPRNRLRTAELTLKELEKERLNKKLQEKLGYSQQADYDRFVESYRQSVDRMRTQPEVAPTPADPNKPATAGPAKLGVGEGGKVGNRADSTKTAVGSGGPSAAPPGYTDAQRRFAEAAARVQPRR